MSYELFVSIRHLSAKKSQKFISLNTWISIAGVGLGVMALIVVIAVMSGFSKDLRDKILGTNSHVVVSNMNRAMVENYDGILKKVRSVEGVMAAAPFIMNQVMLINGDRVSGIVVRGIDPEKEETVSDLGKNMVSGAVTHLKTKSSLVSTHTVESLMERDVIIVGSPDTVREKLSSCHAEVGLGYFLGMFQIGSMPHDLTIASMERFSQEVMKDLMALEGAGKWEPDQEAIPTQAAE